MTPLRPSFAPRHRWAALFSVLLLVATFFTLVKAPSAFAAAPSAPGTWEHTTPLPDGRECGGAVQIGTKLYVFGGHTGANTSNSVNTLRIYDEVTKQWTDGAPMPEARAHFGFAYSRFEGLIYVVGGETEGAYKNATMFYNPSQNKWVTLAAPSYFPKPWHSMDLVIDNSGNIFSFGGTAAGDVHSNSIYKWTKGSPEGGVSGAWSPEATTMRTDSVNGQVRGYAAVERPCSDSTTLAACGDTIYAMGGLTKTPVAYSTNMEAYSITGSGATAHIGAVTAKAPMPTGTRLLYNGTMNGFIYAVGGWTDADPSVTTTALFDYTNNRWVAGPSLNVGRHGAMVGTNYKNHMYAVGGIDGLESGTVNLLSSVEYFDLQNLTATVATSLVNDTSTPGVLNWNSTTPEGVKYTWTVTNNDPRYTSTVGIPSPTAPAGMTCGAVAGPTSIPAGGTVTLSLTCTPSSISYYNMGSAVEVPAMNYTVSGVMNGATYTASTTTATMPKETLTVAGKSSLTAAVGTPDYGTAAVGTAGDQVVYTVSFLNQGTNSLKSVTPESALFSAHPETTMTVVSGDPTNLVPGASVTYRVTLTLTADEAKTNPLSTTVYVSAAPVYCEGSCGARGVATAKSVTLATEAGSITVATPTFVITTDAPTTGLSAGDTGYWSTTVTNNGTAPLTVTQVTDGAGRTYSGTPGNLPPGATSTVFTSPPITLMAADAGTATYSETITATAVPTGCSTSCSPTTASATGSSPLTVYNSSVGVTSAGVITTDNLTAGKVDLNDRVTVTVAVKNTGTAPLSALVVKSSAGTYTCAATTLAVDASTTCTLVTTATAAELQDASFTEAPTVTYTPAYGGSAGSIAAPVVTLPGVTAVRGITITLTSDTASPLYRGTLVSFTYEVKNTGTITLTNLRVTTTTGIIPTCPTTTLAPGAATTCSASQTIS